MSKEIKAYILHCKSLIDRKNYMQSVIERLQLNAEWILDYDAVDLTDDVRNYFYASNRVEAMTRSAKLWGFGHERLLGDGEISIAIKHTLAMQKIASGDEDFSLVLEDDGIFVENFNDLFYEYLQKTPNDWDIIHVGNGYGMRPEKYISSHSGIAYKMIHPASRCAEAILVKKEAAIKISSTMNPFYMAADWELGYQYWLHNLNVYWWDPALVTQGSHNGIFKSSLQYER